MGKKVKQVHTKKYRLELPTGTVLIGPGTVPTSLASPSTTSISEISAAMREISKLGIYKQD